MQIPQVNNGKTPNQYLSTLQMLPLPADTPFGNLALKYHKIISRTDHMNLRLHEVFESFNVMRKLSFMPPGIIEHQFILEEIVYWMRRTIDELISLRYILYQKEITGDYPEKIEIDSIGALLNPKDRKLKGFRDEFSVFNNFFEQFNKISNAHKHSFINSEISQIGNLEPFVFALSLDRNDLGKNPEFHAYKIVDLVSN